MTYPDAEEEALEAGETGVAPEKGEGKTWQDYTSVALFYETARRTSSEFLPSDANIPFVMRICQALEGLPLGIELAAAWVNMMPVQRF